MKSTSILKTAAEAAAEKTQSVDTPLPISSTERYSRALALYESGVCASVADASVYVDLADSLARGVPIPAEAQKFFDEVRSLEIQQEKVSAMRAALVTKQNSRSHLAGRVSHLRHAIAVERDRVASIGDVTISAREAYQRFVGDGAYLLGPIAATVAGALGMKALREFIVGEILPDLEGQLANAEKELSEIEASN